MLGGLAAVYPGRWRALSGRDLLQGRATALMRVHTQLQRAVLGGRGRAALRNGALPAAATLDAARLLQLWDLRGPPEPDVRLSAFSAGFAYTNAINHRSRGAAESMTGLAHTHTTFSFCIRSAHGWRRSCGRRWRACTAGRPRRALRCAGTALLPRQAPCLRSGASSAQARVAPRAAGAASISLRPLHCPCAAEVISMFLRMRCICAVETRLCQCSAHARLRCVIARV